MRSALHLAVSPESGDDRGGIVMGWLTKIAVVLALAGFVLFDAISVGSTTRPSPTRAHAAHEASAIWDETQDVQAAYLAASDAAAEQNPATSCRPRASPSTRTAPCTCGSAGTPRP